MNNEQAARVGVIGGGLGGLAAACTLAARGYQVLLLERNHWLGGKAAVLREQGYRFDMGLTILTLPSALRRIYAEAGRRLEDHLELMCLDPQWRCFFDDGSVLDLRQDAGAMASELAKFSPRAEIAAGYRRFLERSARLNAISEQYFFWRPVGSLRDMFDARTAVQPSMLRVLMDLRPGMSVASMVRSLVPDGACGPDARSLHSICGIGPGPVPCGVVQHCPYANEPGGVASPRRHRRGAESAGGTARELGVEFRCGVGVRRILRDPGGRVRGIETDDGEEIPVAAVVANSDTVRTHRDLIGGTPRRRFERDGGTNRPAPEWRSTSASTGPTSTSRTTTSSSLTTPSEEFDAIYRQGEPAADPTCYVAAPARTEPEVAPPHGEALYVLVHAPYLRPHHDWQRLLPAYRRTILDKLASTGGLHDLERRIRFEHWLTPQDIHDRFGVLDGAIYGLASHGKLLGAFKPSNRSPDVKGLYFAGGSAHPGPGMPMVLMSGWIAADALDRDGVVSRSTAGRTACPQPGKGAESL